MVSCDRTRFCLKTAKIADTPKKRHGGRHYETTRINRRTMGIHRIIVAQTYRQDRPQTQGSTSDAQRHPVDSSYGCSVARPTRAIRPLEDSLSLFLPLARQWNVRSYTTGFANSSGSKRPNRLESLVHRWLQCQGIQGFCRRFKKSLEKYCDEPEDHALGRSKGGFGSKFHLVTDSSGVPLAVEVTAGQMHESGQVETVLDGIGIPQPIGRPRKRPKQLTGDKAYSVHRIRDWLHAHGIRPVIPRKSNEKYQHNNFDKQSYRRRAVIEQCVGWLKECRRIATRFEKLALSFLAMFKLAMIERYFKIVFSDRT